MNILLTPRESRLARKHLKFTQKHCAIEASISLTYLSKFECEKMYLNDIQLNSLLNFYKNSGYSIPQRNLCRDRQYLEKMQRLAVKTRITRKRASVPTQIYVSAPPELVKLDAEKFYNCFQEYIDQWLEEYFGSSYFIHQPIIKSESNNLNGSS